MEIGAQGIVVWPRRSRLIPHLDFMSKVPVPGCGLCSAANKIFWAYRVGNRFNVELKFAISGEELNDISVGKRSAPDNHHVDSVCEQTDVNRTTTTA
jgi:hypothetical protein